MTVEPTEISTEDEAVGFVMRLGRALHTYGAPAHRLEDAMFLAAARLGLQGQFFSLPTSILASFGPPERQRTSLLRVQPGEVNLAKLSLLNGISNQVVDAEITPAAGMAEVERIMDAPSPYPTWLMVLAHGVASAAAGRFFGGGAREIGIAGVIGLLIGILSLFTGRIPGGGRVFEPLGGFIAALVATLATRFVGPHSGYVAILGGIIVLVPGLTLTIGLKEIATRNLVSGTARLTAALLVFAQIGLGVALGDRVGLLLTGAPGTSAPLPLPDWTLWVALLAAPLGFMILFRARPRDVGVVYAGALLAFAGARVGTTALGPEIGAGAGALLIGVASNLYGRHRDRLATVPLVPGIIMLVPGSIGFRSFTMFLSREIVSGLDTAFTMVLVGVALVAGLLLANTLVPPKRAL